MPDISVIAEVLPEFVETASDVAEAIQAKSDKDLLVNLSSRIEEYLDSLKGEESTDRSNGYYHPSEIPYCLLAAAHRKIGTPFVKRHEVSTQLTFDIGHAVHGVIQGYLVRTFGKENVRIEPDVTCEALRIKGHADAIVLVEGTPTLVEIKSKRTLDKQRKAVRQHLMQAHLYMYAERIAVGTIFYVDKSDTKMVDYPFLFDFDVLAEAVDRIAECEFALKNGRMPTAEPGLWCNECGVNHLCDAWLLDKGRRTPRSLLRLTTEVGRSDVEDQS